MNAPLRPLLILAAALAVFAPAPAALAADAPAGFTSLFNGSDLSGWRGGDTKDHRWLMSLAEAERAKTIAAWTEDMKKHWKVEGGELVNDGRGKYATTEAEFGDFELLVEYNMAPNGDSGIYLRNVPQVQIWDPKQEDPGGKLGRAKGSGGLWNNRPGSGGKDPLVLADKPAGEWNKFRIVMVGSRVSVWLNDQLVVDHAILENFYDEGRAVPIPARGPICLQTHGAPIQWRHIFIREIGAEEAAKILASKAPAEGFEPIWNGRDFSGWAGPVDHYETDEGAIRCRPGKGGTIYWNQELSDFTARLEFKLPPGGNNGLAIRYPGEGDAAYVGMCEVQVLDDSAEKYAKLDPRQYHGSAYGIAAAHRGYLRPVGEWNFQEVTVKGSRIAVELNGTVILDSDLAKVDPATYLDGKAHPGLSRSSGFFGFAGHGDAVAFRNIFVRKH